MTAAVLVGLGSRAYEVLIAPGLLDAAGARIAPLLRRLISPTNTRGRISKKSMIHNGATPDIEVDPETYEVRADGELLTCAPAEVLPMAQRYFMF